MTHQNQKWFEWEGVGPNYRQARKLFQQVKKQQKRAVTPVTSPLAMPHNDININKDNEEHEKCNHESI